MNDAGEESSGDAEDDEMDSDGNVANTEPSTRRLGAGGGPWKKVIPAEEVTQIPMDMEKPSSKVYILPALRNAQAAAMGRAKIRNLVPTSPMPTIFLLWVRHEPKSSG